MQLSLYIHFPFCKNKCSYCDFYKELHNNEHEEEFYQALCIETELASEDSYLQNAVIDTIFIGGGTPSLTSLSLFADWLSHLKRYFTISDNLEFSIECNPESVTLEKLKILSELGVNRPVFGVQSFDTETLKLLDRKHSIHDSYQAVYYANLLDLKNFGVDLIFGLPYQNSQKLSYDIDQIIDLEPAHISFYQLTVEPGTKLASKIDRGKIKLPDSDLMLGLYRGGCEKMSEEGFQRYEVSSFAKEGLECRHNTRYWDGSDYLGLGPAAHSFINGQRFYNISNLHEYNSKLRSGIFPRTVDKSGLEERMTEAIMLGLRMSKGINRSAFRKRFGISLRNRLDKKQYDLFIESGHLIPDKGRLRLSDEGFYLADEITRRLVK